MSARCWIAIAAVLALLAPPLHADPAPAADETSARQHFARGKQLATARDFAHAYDEFAAGYELSHRSSFLFNMAECVRLLGDAPRARALYTRYLAITPDGELATAARARVTQLGGVVPEPPAPLPAAPPIPPPQVAARQVATAPPDAAIDLAPPRPLWHRAPFWVGVGLALAGGAVGAYVLLHRHASCTPPTCVELP